MRKRIPESGTPRQGMLERAAGEANRKAEHVAVGTVRVACSKSSPGGATRGSESGNAEEIEAAPPAFYRCVPVAVCSGCMVGAKPGFRRREVAGGRRNGFLRLAAVSVDSFAPAHLALRAAFGSLPCGCPRRLGCAPCTKRSTSPIHEALSRWFCHSATNTRAWRRTSSSRSDRAVSWLIPQADF